MIESLLIQAVIAYGLLSTGPLVSVKADFDFTVRFYEYWNPTGLCAECGTNGVPVCCDDPLLTESCQNTGVFRCDTRIRYILRPFNTPLKTAPDTGFPFFTPSNTNENHETFHEGDRGFLGSPNPSTFTSTSPWTGKLQLLVDAFDRFNSNPAPNETKAIIDRFLINLDQLQLGADLTEETTYTGIHNIAQLSMSFHVECSENYYGSDCTTFCEAVEGVYNCSSNGSVVCIEENRNSSTKCLNCAEKYYGSNCTTFCEAVEGVYNCDNNGSIVCVEKNQDSSSMCINCTENYYGSDCTTFCEPMEGVYNCSSNGSVVCIQENRNSSTNCLNCTENYYGSNCATFCITEGQLYSCNSNGIITCIDDNRDLQKNCTQELNRSGVNISILIGGVVGGLVGLLLISILFVLIVLCLILRLQHRHKRESYAIASNAVDYVEQLSEDTPNKKENFQNSTASNPIYWATEPTTTTTTFNNTIYDEPQLELTQSVKKNNTSEAATYETVDCLKENKTNHTGQVEVLDNPNYSEIMESTATTTGPGKHETEKDMLVFDDPEYGTASYEEKEPPPSTVFDCAEYECPTVTVPTNDTANIQQTHQQPSATIFDSVEYESPTVPESSGYSVLKHSKATVDHSTSTPQGTVTTDTTTAGKGYSKLHHNTDTEANCHTQNTQHPSPQSIYNVATSNGTEQSHEKCKEDALVYHYATVESPAHHHPTISDSANNDNTPGYVNTTPGKMTPEALDHYDLGQ